MKKTDNHNLAAKLELRRRLLREFPNAGGYSVVDCFSGGEVLWKTLAAEFDVRDYLALDVKPKRGRLKMDSLRYLQNQVWTQDVIDCDAYGSPWRHWFEILKRRREALVFLTIGSTMFGNQQAEALAAVGITFKIPIGLHAAVADLCTTHCLAAAFDHGFEIQAAYESLNPGGSARYIGIKIRPA